MSSVLTSLRRHSTNQNALSSDTLEGHYIQPTISTLRTESLTEADFIRFPVEQEYAFVWDSLAPSATAISKDKTRPFAPFRPGGEGASFPAGLQGYLYYYLQPSPAPPTAGEIRFRTMYSSSPLSFNNGKDFKSAHDLPWRLQLPTVAANDAHQVFRNILLRDGLVSRETMALAAEMGRQREMIKWQALPPLVHSFKQPWYIDLGSRMHWWHFMGKDKVYQSRPISNILTWKVGDQRVPPPWLGGAICTFVPDDHPRHGGRRVLNVKFLRGVEAEPIRRNPGFPEDLQYLITEPKPGKKVKRGQTVWQLDVNRCIPSLQEGFHVLHENAELPPLRLSASLRSRAPGEREEMESRRRRKQTVITTPSLTPRVS